MGAAHQGRHGVWRVEREEDGRRLVLKVAERPELREGLRREHALLSALELDGVVQALGLEERDDAAALVLEDAGPETLASWLRGRSRLLAPERFLALVVPLARTVAALHARSLIHGDLTPHNLVVDAGGERLTLVDFGSAIDTAAVAHEAALERMAGALEYMAPEQSGRLNRMVDHRADLYSLGITFYEMLCGSVPFSSPDPVELLHAHLARAPVPPASVHASVPPVLSDIVLRLLQKMPEERYQSAAALAADLEEAARQLAEGGRIARFVLGRADTARALPSRTAFQGRRAELEAFEASVERAAAGGGCEVVLLRGGAGIGKSALVEQMAARAGERALFLRGKCDAMRRDVPYAPLAEAFGAFVRDAAAAPEGTRALRRRLRESVGNNLPLLASALPLAELGIAAEPVLSLGPVEAERRFQLSFSGLVRAVRAGRPLVLFVDDLHWADAATLRLFEHLAGDPGSGQLVLLGAYRDEEVGPDHVLTRSLEALRASPASVREIELGALGADEVGAICADLLRAPVERVAPLAAYAHRKTGGNAFFVQQLLRSLVDGGQLRFDLVEGAWRWDMAEVARVKSATAVERLGNLVRALPARTRRAVQTAACFSHRIDLPLLSQILEQPVDETAADLWPAIEADLLVPGAAATWGASVAYQFLHDRVHQAARELLSDADRQRIHLRIGSVLLGGDPPEALGDRLFDAVDQLDLGAALITETPRRVGIAELNLRAGEMARARAAYGPALAYLQKGIELLPRAPDAAPRELRFRLHRDAAECAYLSGRIGAADELAQTAYELAACPFERAEVYNIRITAFASYGHHERAIALGREALALFDVELPPSDAPEALWAIFATVREQMGTRPPEELLGLPRMTDRATLARMEVLANLLSPALISDQKLFAAVTARMVSLSLTHGNSVYSAFSYAAYGMLLVAFEQDHARGHACGRLGVELARRFGDPVQECRAIHVFCCFVNHWRAPLASSLPLIRAGIARGLEAGELQYATLAQTTHAVCLYHLGIELSQVTLELGASLPLAHSSRNKAAHDYELAYRQVIRCLQGTTAERGSFDDDDFRESDYLEAAGDNPVAVGLYLVLRLEASYLFGNLDEARALSERVEPVLFALEVLFPVVEHALYTALVLAADADRDPAQRAAAVERIAALRERLDARAVDCADNFRAKERIVAAELSRLRGDHDAAAARYDEAIDAARRAGMLKDEALAGELCARFWQGRGRERIAGMYLREAVVAYQRWGALAKVAALEAEASGALHGNPSAWAAPGIAPAAAASAIDLLGLLKAAGRICAEVAIDRLVEKLLSVCFELAGATRGGLIMAEDGQLVVLALGSTTEPVSLVRAPLSSVHDLPAATIRQAWEAETQIVAADAARHRRFSSDPYFARNKIRSVLVMPIQRQATATGILYLENRLAADVFSPDRVSLMRLLSSQIAISLENSSLFEKLKIESEENARLYQEAQQSIRLRNEFLSVASHELRTPIASLQLAVQGLQSSLRSSPESFPQVLALAERQVQRLSSLVDELLTVSRLQEGRLDLTLEPTELVALAREVTERFAFQAERAGCRLVVTHDGEVVGHWDRGRLDQVVTNLLSNALKFGPGKPIEIDVRRHGGRARLRMSDHGIGIAPERATDIFKRFERAVPASRYGGLGLGLYISYQIVEALDGSIEVESEPGVGATFTVDLPLEASDRGRNEGDGNGDGTEDGDAG